MDIIKRIKKDNIPNTFFNILLWLIASFILVFIGECFQRLSLNLGWYFLISKPRIFLLNYTMFLSVTSISFLFAKTRFIYGLLSGILFMAHCVSGVINSFRGTPLIWADLYSIKSGLGIATKYLNIITIVIALIGIIIFIILEIFLWKTEKVERKNKFFRINGVILIVPILVGTIFFNKYLDNKGTMWKYGWDIPGTFKGSGFMCAFLYTRSGFKVDKPTNYTKDRIDTISKNIEKSEEAINVDNINSNKLYKPNIIMVQLESFFDPYRLNGIEFSEDPIPTYRELSKTSLSGKLNVPAYGGGTVRTEFEILTGFSTDYLPVGEIPNNNVLKKQAVESLAYILRDYDYESTLLHNYYGDYYNRNMVYSNLGFDRFISKELMPKPIEREWKSYPNDTLNLPYIERIINENEAPQFIYNVTVEGHGPYDSEYQNEFCEVKGNITEKDSSQIQHYITVLKEVDNYIKKLKNYVDTIDEPTMVVLFSDHLPSLDILNSNIEMLGDSKEQYITEYIIIDNMGVTKNKEGKDIEAYQLGSEILSLINISNGIMPEFHKAYKNELNYDKELKNLQYDILFGKQYIYNKENPYISTNMSFGIDEIKVTDYYIENNDLIIKGENFNYISTANVNKKDKETIFENKTTLRVPNYNKKINQIKIIQKGLYGTILGESDIFTKKNN